MLDTRVWLKRTFKSRKLPLILIVLVLSTFTLIYSLLPPIDFGTASQGFKVPVLLAAAPQGSSLRFAVEGPYKIFEGGVTRAYDTRECLYSGLKLGRAEVVMADEAGFRINGNPIPGDEFLIVPQRDGLLEAGGKQYSGVFRIHATGSGTLRLFNIVELEAYLAGVLFKEMPSSYPEEALKAQAVAARTYTLHRMVSGSAYLTDDSRSQVYGGLSAVTAKSRAIVEATRGEVLVYNEEILPAYYNSTCGGTTARASDAFTGEAPLPVDVPRVCGYCSDSPYYRWRAVFPWPVIVERLDMEESLSSLEIGITGCDTMRRATEISLLDGRGKLLCRYPAETFRYKVNQGRPLKERILSTRIDRISPKREAVVFEGQGWGHGVGLCQYGARGLARAGKNYRQILSYYYEGADLEPDYGGL